MKPLGIKAYGSIPHLIGSRMGSGDHHAELGQCRIATEKKRDKHDYIIVQEKLDGGNVAVAKHQGRIIGITRSGYLAYHSKYKTHQVFSKYVAKNEDRFDEILNEGDRICGEWLFTAVGTIYNLPHESFVAFDLMNGKNRYSWQEFKARLAYSHLPIATAISIGEPLSIESSLELIKCSNHGAVEPVEGAVWRVERKQEVDFLVKYVRPEKVDGKYLNDDIVNGMPYEFDYLIKYFKSL